MKLIYSARTTSYHLANAWKNLSEQRAKNENVGNRSRMKKFACTVSHIENIYLSAKRTPTHTGHKMWYDAASSKQPTNRIYWHFLCNSSYEVSLRLYATNKFLMIEWGNCSLARSWSIRSNNYLIFSQNCFPFIHSKLWLEQRHIRIQFVTQIEKAYLIDWFYMLKFGQIKEQKKKP